MHSLHNFTSLLFFSYKNTDLTMALLNETNTTGLDDIDVIWSAIGAVHLVFVFIPSLVIGATVLVHVWKLMGDKKASEINQTLLVYFVLISTCMLAPSTYGILWDISLITGIPTMGNCASYPSNVVGTLVFCVFQILVSFILSLVAVFQLITIKFGKKITLKVTIASLSAVLLASVVIPGAVIFTEKKNEEIRGSLCVSDKKETIRNTAMLVFVAYVLPLIVNIIASVLTHRKLKECIIDDPRSGVVKSVLIINSFNIVQFIIVRAVAVSIFYIAVSTAPDDQRVFLVFTVLARYVGDLSYPITICSVLIVHKSLRSMLLAFIHKMCGKQAN